MKLKKQQIMILAIVFFLIISVSSFVLMLNTGNEDSPSGNGDMVETGNWIDISSNIQSVTAKSEYGIHSYGDVFFIDENEGWVASSSINEIYHTTDGGETWGVQITEYDTTAIWMLDKNEGYAGGRYGRVYRTTDGGKKWNAIGSIGITLTDISFSSGASTGFACGLNSAYARIGPEGVTMIEKITYGDIDSVSATAPDEAIFCGGRLLLHYIDGAMIADQDPDLPGKTYLYTVFMLNKKEGWAAGSKINHTVDGQNWTQQTNPDQANDRGMHDVFFLNSNEGWIIGERGLIMHTTNGGTTWMVEAEGVTDNYLCAVHFPSSNVGYVCGNDGTLLKFNADK